MRGIFVTATDTGVGKTVVCAALMHRYVGTQYWKPIQTGIETDDDTTEILRLIGGGASGIRSRGIRLRDAVSPHLAAQRAGVRIDLDALTDLREMASPNEEHGWIVEGAGGVLVPLNDTQTMADLMMRLALPVLVVARTTLGTINHTLMTLEAIRSRSLTVAGVVMSGVPDIHNRAAIERYGNVAVLGELPRFDPLTRQRLAQWSASNLDPENRLAEFLA